MIVTDRDLERCLGRLREVAGAKEDYRDRMHFFMEVLKLLHSRRQGAMVTPELLTEEEARQRMENGFPLMDRWKLSPDIPLLKGIYQDLLKLVAREKKLADEAIDMAAELAADDMSFAGSVTAVFREGIGDMAGEPDPAAELKAFLLHSSLKPYHEIYAMAYGKIGVSLSWEEGYCPICGGGPAMGGLFEEEGKRKLLCHRCGFVWPFARVRCPFCRNASHEKLRYFTSDAQPVYRVDLCDACRGYLKVVDSRKFPGEVILEAEDLATPHYDLIAAREGYLKKVPNILGLFR